MPYRQDSLKSHNSSQQGLTHKAVQHSQPPITAQSIPHNVTRLQIEHGLQPTSTSKRRMRRTGSSPDPETAPASMALKGKTKQHEKVTRVAESDRQTAKTRQEQRTEPLHDDSNSDHTVTPEIIASSSAAKNVEDHTRTRNVTPGSSPSRKRQRVYGDRWDDSLRRVRAGLIHLQIYTQS